ncbi:MAG TPA: cytochrome c-type biogenesis protein [Methylomirabilota bacterium]|nr:cytochrome c-type biogenesis protein [Methylomirabilota bacterium]
MSRHAAAALGWPIVWALVLALGWVSQGRAALVTDEAVTAVASQLRCVVCQNLSVADSPSEMARQMRDLIRERLAQGETPEQVIVYFEERYGDWVLLTPRPRGFNLLVWAAPFAAVFVGLLAVLRVTRRWSRRVADAPGGPTPDALSPEDRERLRAELERLRE